MMDRYTTVVSAEVLQQALPTKNWLVLDCRFNLADTAYGSNAYQQGHIPGAFYLHLDNDLSSSITPTTGRHPLPNSEVISQKLANLGLNQDRQVVVYDDCGGAMAVRAWWILRWLGHKAVAVLDGGYPAWLERQGAVETVLSVPPIQVGNFKVQVQPQMMVNADTLLTDSSLQLIDARPAERFRGEVEPLDPVAGHVPHALNRPMFDNLSNGKFKTAEQLRVEWQAILGDRDLSTIVHMCGSGVTACHNQLAMEIAGMTGTCLYPGSWSEWIRDTSRPIAKG